jgi:phage shock protein PspC (stress-responsive transcriptional regulator)
MKQVENVSIGGYAFSMETGAAQSARQYLDEIAVHYAADGSEVLDGIEERMAELLNERTSSSGVVTSADIEAVINVLGRPEAIDNDSPEPAAKEKKKKRLYRDLENKKILGVCSGIAKYFDIQVPFVRLVFAVAFVLCYLWGYRSYDNPLGYPYAWYVLGLYLILALCIPAAKTVRQKWESKGEDGSLEGIRHSVSKAAEGIEKGAGRIARSESWSAVARFLLAFIGIVLIITGFTGILTGGIVVFGHQVFGEESIFAFIVEQLSTQPWAAMIMEVLWVKILAVVVYFLPFIGLLYAGIMLTFNLRSPKWHPGLILFVLWLLSIIALVVIVAMASTSWYTMPIDL